MSFYMMPSFQQVPNVAYPFETSYQTHQNRPQYHHVLHPHVVTTKRDEMIPFKVYIFDRKFNQHNTQLSNASNILRFEIEATSGRSLDLFDRALIDHSINMNSFNMYYLDDENDLVALSTERDFLFMTKLMKGKLTKIICEKKSRQQPTIHFRNQIPEQTACFGGQCPLFGFSNKRAEQQQSQPVEKLIEKALSSVFSCESTPKQAQERTYTFFPSTHVVASQQQPIRKEAPRTRTIEINLADLLGIPRSKEQAPLNQEKNEQPMKKESNDEKKEEPSQSFRDFLVQRLKERYPAEPKQVETPQQSEEQPKNEESKDETPKEEQTISVSDEEPTNIVNNLTTSLLLSNNLETAQVEETIEAFEPTNIEPTQTKEQQSTSAQDLESQDPIIESIEEEPQFVKTTIPHKYQRELKMLNEMGFSNQIENVNLLNKYEGDIQRTISDLINQ